MPKKAACGFARFPRRKTAKPQAAYVGWDSELESVRINRRVVRVGFGAFDRLTRVRIELVIGRGD